MNTKGELVGALAASSGLTKADAEKAVNALATVIRDGLTGAGEVVLYGVGKFEAKDRPQRNGRNPSTGAAIIVPAKVALKFKPAAEIRKALNPKLA